MLTRFAAILGPVGDKVCLFGVAWPICTFPEGGELLEDVERWSPPCTVGGVEATEALPLLPVWKGLGDGPGDLGGATSGGALVVEDDCCGAVIDDAEGGAKVPPLPVEEVKEVFVESELYVFAEVGAPRGPLASETGSTEGNFNVGVVIGCCAGAVAFKSGANLSDMIFIIQSSKASGR